ncbi:MAG: hypothetical protein JNK04_22945, partial [Myxococcales bacterium]|nr:hypothetical protein [Myxococcales bacterium]
TPTAAFYVVPSFERHRAALGARGLTTSSALAAALLREAGIAALPGSAFGRDPAELTLRLSLVDFDGTAALRALGDTVDESFLRRLCPRVTAGVDALAAWLRSARATAI